MRRNREMYRRHQRGRSQLNATLVPLPETRIWTAVVLGTAAGSQLIESALEYMYFTHDKEMRNA
jgi:hypothetical protein